MNNTDAAVRTMKVYDLLLKRSAWPPTCGQIAKHMKVTPATVAYHMRRLHKQGIVKKVGTMGQWVRDGEKDLKKMGVVQ